MSNQLFARRKPSGHMEGDPARPPEIARSIQQSLLPQGPSSDLSVLILRAGTARRTIPAATTMTGLPFPNGKVIVSLADVTGHGIGPAYLPPCATLTPGPISVLHQNLPAAFEHINQQLGADLGPGRFVTFAAAVCCPGCAEVEMLSAGHGPLLVYSRPQDRFTRMNGHALPFGILPDFQSEPQSRIRTLMAAT